MHQVQLLGQPISVGRPSGYVDPMQAQTAAAAASAALAAFKVRSLSELSAIDLGVCLLLSNDLGAKRLVHILGLLKRVTACSMHALSYGDLGKHSLQPYDTAGVLLAGAPGRSASHWLHAYSLLRQSYSRYARLFCCPDAPACFRSTRTVRA